MRRRPPVALLFPTGRGRKIRICRLRRSVPRTLRPAAVVPPADATIFRIPAATDHLMQSRRVPLSIFLRFAAGRRLRPCGPMHARDKADRIRARRASSELWAADPMSRPVATRRTRPRLRRGGVSLQSRNQETAPGRFSDDDFRSTPSTAGDVQEMGDEIRWRHELVPQAPEQVPLGTRPARADTATVFAAGFNDPLDGPPPGSSPAAASTTCIPNLWLPRTRTGWCRCAAAASWLRVNGFSATTCGRLARRCSISPSAIAVSRGDEEGKTLHSPRRRYSGNADGSDLGSFTVGCARRSCAFDQYGNLFADDNNCDKGDRALVYVVEGDSAGTWRIRPFQGRT